MKWGMKTVVTVLLGLVAVWLLSLIVLHPPTKHRNPLPSSRFGGNFFDFSSSSDGDGVSKAEIERRLRAATDEMKLHQLRAAIGVAEKAKYTVDSLPALRTAKFVHEHLSEAHVAEIHKIAKEQGHDVSKAGVTPSGAAPATDSIATATPANAFPPPPEAVSVVFKPEPEGSPEIFKWWSSAPESLKGLLPPMPAAASFEKIEEPEEVVAKRFDAIVNLSEKRFQAQTFPIGIVAYNRPELLKLCITSLLSLRGIDKKMVVVYQDGQDQFVKAVADELGVTVKQHLGNANKPGQEGAAQIARHYRWTFTSMFDDFPGSQYAIIVEDDMIFAPDFLSYFTQLAPIYEKDPSVYCITSWNDNAQAGLAADPRVLLRTDFFIGLGWMISRKIYKEELEQRWPHTHWDHWLREPQQRKERQCIYPEVTRNYNIGKRGTHSDDNMYAQYFQKIVMNQQAAVWLGDVNRMLAMNYELGLMNTIENAIQINSINEANDYRYKSLAAFIELSNRDDTRWEKVYAPFFGLWHSIPHIRGMYNSAVISIRYKTNYLKLVASFQPSYMKLKKNSVNIIAPNDFRISLTELSIVKANEGGENCEDACKRFTSNVFMQDSKQRPGAKPRQFVCSKNGLARINECAVMQKQFDCVRCEMNYGADQPAWVFKKDLSNYKVCLVNSQEPECHGGHSDTARLCACVEETR